MSVAINTQEQMEKYGFTNRTKKPGESWFKDHYFCHQHGYFPKHHSWISSTGRKHCPICHTRVRQQARKRK